ncbi:ATP-binding protein, partial [Candidatus Saccharibacteria bacterium]|nr:ATP-binding protein [Candidatus Saccharibacteria bacterium]
MIEGIFNFFLTVLIRYYGWLPLAGFLVWRIIVQNRQIRLVEDQKSVLLQIIIPRENDKSELAAEQMFASLHGILRSKTELRSGMALQESLSFELVGSKNIYFYLRCPEKLENYVEGQIYAQYPNVQIIKHQTDYLEGMKGKAIGSEIVLKNSQYLPIKTFSNFEVDPLSGITAVLSSLESDQNLAIQMIVRPISDDWHKDSQKEIAKVRSGKPLISSFANLPAGLMAWVRDLFHALLVGPVSIEESHKSDKLSSLATSQVAGIEEKATKLGFQVMIRVIYIGDQSLAQAKLQAVYGSFKQFNTQLNGFRAGSTKRGEQYYQDFKNRVFDTRYSFILNTEELASLFHFPHTSVETPNLAWTGSKQAEPPQTLPIVSQADQADISLIGQTMFRQHNAKFGIKRSDRARHLYVIGKSGSGKSYLLTLLAISDIYHNQGFAIIDPHGELARDVMSYIPEQRLADVVYFNPSDRDNPVAFNPMEVTNPNFRPHIASEIIGVLHKIFADSWGPRLEHILRYCLLALLEYPDATMLGIVRMLTDSKYRKKVVDNVTDPVVKAFWVNEFASWDQRFASEATSSILNKVGAFTANPLIRNVLGQPKSSFDIRQIMDQGKILIVDLSRGLIGEDNASILGALMITKIQLAAMSRADTLPANRRPFYLYVDEFQNFATESFAVILSEARKYA